MSTQTLCPVCRHSQRDRIDAELAEGKHRGTLADAYGLAGTAIRQHAKTCLGQQVQRQKAPTTAVAAAPGCQS